MAEDNEKGGGAQGKKKRSMLMIILIAVVVLLLAVGGFIVWQLFMTPKPNQAVTETKAAKTQTAETEETETKTFALDTFVVNLADPGGNRYLKTDIQLEYVAKNLGDELTHRLPQLRDLILLILSSKTLDDIQTVDGKIALRQELIQRINQILTTGKIQNLYFTQFVIQ